MCGRLASELRYCCTAGDLRPYWCSRFHWSSSQVKHRRPCPNYLPTRSDESKSSVADGYESIGEYLAKIVIDRTAARPVTWSKKRSITSFNASINLVATHCTIALQACPRLFGRGKPPIYSSTPFGLALWRGLMAIRLQPSGRCIYPTFLWSSYFRAYVEQTSLGWNLLFRGFWTISRRTAQEYEFSHSPFQRGIAKSFSSQRSYHIIL
jgi:hypothetical protein